MKVDLNKNVKGLNGEDLQDANMGKIVANSLVAGTKGNAIKFFDWAMKLYNGQVIDLDKADQKTLKDFIENNETLTILFKAQVLEQLENE